MFTGIVEEMGTVKATAMGPHSARWWRFAQVVLEDLHIGDSIAVNGVCLTATAFSPAGFTADVMHETLNRSALALLRPGSRVNLERALAAGGRFGGHIVAGHVDGVGTRPADHPGRQRRLVYHRRRPGDSALRGGEGLHRHRWHQPDGGQGGRPVLRHLRHSPHRLGHHPGPPGGWGTL